MDISKLQTERGNCRKFGDKAFYECKCLAEMIIPDSVSEIDTFAFYHCDSMKSIRLSKNLMVMIL